MDRFAGYKSCRHRSHPRRGHRNGPFHVGALAGEKAGSDPRARQRIAHTRIQLLSARKVRPPDRHFRHRRAPRGQSRLADLPAHHRRLQQARPPPRQDHNDQVHRPATPWCPHRAGRIAQHGRTRTVDATTCRPTSTTTHPNGPTEAINGRLEALRRNVLGFRNLTQYRIHSVHVPAIKSCPQQRACIRQDIPRLLR